MHFYMECVAHPWLSLAVTSLYSGVLGSEKEHCALGMFAWMFITIKVASVFVLSPLVRNLCRIKIVSAAMAQILHITAIRKSHLFQRLGEEEAIGLWDQRLHRQQTVA